MRWIVLMGVGALCWAMQLGCSGNMTETPAEIAHGQRHQVDIESRELQEDIETFLLMDRPSRLTRWQTE